MNRTLHHLTPYTRSRLVTVALGPGVAASSQKPPRRCHRQRWGDFHYLTLQALAPSHAGVGSGEAPKKPRLAFISLFDGPWVVSSTALISVEMGKVAHAHLLEGSVDCGKSFLDEECTFWFRNAFGDWSPATTTNCNRSSSKSKSIRYMNKLETCNIIF